MLITYKGGISLALRCCERITRHSPPLAPIPPHSGGGDNSPSTEKLKINPWHSNSNPCSVKDVYKDIFLEQKCRKIGHGYLCIHHFHLSFLNEMSQRFRVKWSYDRCGCANKFFLAWWNICTVLYRIYVQHICKLPYISQYKLYTIQEMVTWLLWLCKQVYLSTKEHLYRAVQYFCTTYWLQWKSKNCVQFCKKKNHFKM